MKSTRIPRGRTSEIRPALAAVFALAYLSGSWQGARAQTSPQWAAAPADPAESFGVEDTVEPLPPKPAALLPSEAAGLDLRGIREVRLEAVDTQALRAEDAQLAAIEKVSRYGVGRALGVDLAAGEWYDIADFGQLWVLDVVATDAIGIRVHFAEVSLPPAAQLFVYSPTHPDRVWGPYEHRGPFETGEVWVPTVFGERARIEYFIPDDGAEHADKVSAEVAEDDADAPPFVIDRIQHIYRDPVLEDPGRVGSCHNDVTCYSAWANSAKAAAGIGTINSDALYCSGTMLAAGNNDLTPYWLTANHCIGSASTAQNAEIYWLYQTSACNGTPPSLSSVPQSAVCTRLSYSSASDYSLLMVEGTVPAPYQARGERPFIVAAGDGEVIIAHRNKLFTVNARFTGMSAVAQADAGAR